MVSAEYLAGFIDGEGTICAYAYFIKSSFVTALRVEVYNCNLEALLLIQQDWGGRIQTSASSKFEKNPNWRKSYSLVWGKRKDVKRILEAVNPFLLIKNRQVAYVLENWPLHIETGGLHLNRVSKEEQDKRIATVEAIRKFNKRGAEADRVQ